ncbi:MAG TPA: phosphatase PAP2 family protein [Ilumatobacteraceae bacterium]
MHRDETTAVATADRPPEPSHDDRPWWKQSPIDRRGWLVLLAAYLGMAAVLTAIGFVIVGWWDESAFGEADADVNRWFADRRTDTWNTLSTIGSYLSDTYTKVTACLLLLPLFLWLFRRWHDWALIVVTLVLEASTFITAATIVGRDRPPVERIDSAPTASFPSGHIAASVAFYAALAVVVSWHTRNRLVRGLFIALAVIAPIIVSASRMYRGMHYPTDAVFGLILGGCSLLIVHYVMRHANGGRSLSTVT